MDQNYFAQRALYYWAKLYTEQLAAGINYDGLNSISIIKYKN